MALVPIDPIEDAEIVSDMTADEAEVVERTICHHLDEAWRLTADFVDRRGFVALGFTSYEAWAKARLGVAERAAKYRLAAARLTLEIEAATGVQHVAPLPVRESAALTADPAAKAEVIEAIRGGADPKTAAKAAVYKSRRDIDRAANGIPVDLPEPNWPEPPTLSPADEKEAAARASEMVQPFKDAADTVRAGRIVVLLQDAYDAYLYHSSKGHLTPGLLSDIDDLIADLTAARMNTFGGFES